MHFSVLNAQDIQPGIKMMRNYKYGEAKSFFKSLLNSNIKSIASYYLGSIYFIEDEIDLAETFFESGISLDKNEALNYAGMVKCNLYKNQNIDAEKFITQSIELSDDNNDKVYHALAEAYAQDKIKNYDKALSMLSEALRINPKATGSLLLQGEIYLLKGNGTEAIRSSERILEYSPNDPDALRLKAKVYTIIGKINEAIRLLEDAIKNDIEFSPAYEELAEIYASQKDYLKAAETYSKFIFHSETTIKNQKRFASILYINKDYERAINILKNCLVSDSADASSLRIIAYAYLRQDSIDQSKNYFEKLFDITSAELQSSDFENYADLLIKSGDELKALNYFNKVIELDPSRKDILGKISVINFKNKNWAGVINALKDKGNLTAQEYFDLSKSYIFKGDANITDALHYCSSEMSFDIEQIDKIRQLLLHYQAKLSEFKFDIQKLTEAKNELSTQVDATLKSNQKAQWNQIKTGWISLVDSTISTDYSSADSLLGILLTKAPNLAVAYLWQARVKANFDPETETALAKPYYEKYIDLTLNEKDKYKKELVEAFSYLGYYYYLQKDNQKSKDNWLQVINIEPENKQAIEVLKQLR